jgi:L-lactate dehydrogenase complex protein LldF
MHIVLVDNGRTRLLADPQHRSALACIRCGACLNTCPVYRHAGGYSYQQTVPGPIGAVLAPVVGSGPDARELPHASSLCGSCTAVCPVKIDLHGQLLAWRRELYPPSAAAGLGARIAAAVLLRPRLYRAAGRILRLLWPLASRRWPANPAAPWLESRALPAHPGASFASRYRAQKRDGA